MLGTVEVLVSVELEMLVVGVVLVSVEVLVEVLGTLLVLV